METEGTGTAIRFDKRMLENFAASLERSPHSVASYRKCLAYFFAYLSERGITRPESGDIAAYREILSASGKKPGTVHSYLAAVKAFFRWAEAKGFYPDIAEKIVQPKVDHVPHRKTLTGAQMKKVLDGIDREDIRGKRDYALLALMVTGGLERLEVVQAQVGDLKMAQFGPVLQIRGGKGGSVKVPPRTWRALLDYLEARGPLEENAPLFVSVSNRTQGQDQKKPLSVGSVSRIVKDALRNAGFDDVMLSAQSLRFTALKLALQGGESLEDVQKFARHRTIRTTFLYEQKPSPPVDSQE